MSYTDRIPLLALKRDKQKVNKTLMCIPAAENYKKELYMRNWN